MSFLCHRLDQNTNNHGLRTPNEGKNQRYLKNWADVADKICCRHTYKFGIGIEFSAVQWRLFPLWASVVRGFNRSMKVNQKLLKLLNKK